MFAGKDWEEEKHRYGGLSSADMDKGLDIWLQGKRSGGSDIIVRPASSWPEALCFGGIDALWDDKRQVILACDSSGELVSSCVVGLTDEHRLRVVDFPSDPRMRKVFEKYVHEWAQRMGNTVEWDIRPSLA